MSGSDAGHQGCEPPEEEVSIQDVTRERLARRKLKAELKRQVDLQRIKDMKSTTGIDPLQRFPKEIWAMIFDELSPDDRANVWQVHPLFRDLLESTRLVHILFPQILKVHTFVEDHILWDEEYDDVGYTEHLRCVSKGMRKWFDRFMEDNLRDRIFIQGTEDQVGYATSTSFVIGAVNLFLHDPSHRLKLKRMLESFSDSKNPGKRFFPRDLAISLSRNSSYDNGGRDVLEFINEFIDNLWKLLDKIGDQIWYLRFNFCDLESEDSSPSQVYQLLHRWILLTPNLKWLELDVHTSLQVFDEDDIIFQEHAFPRLSSLERLGIHCHHLHDFDEDNERDRNAFRITETVLAANQHVQMLDVGKTDDEDLKRLPRDLIKSLPLTCFSVYNDDPIDMQSLHGIQQIVNFNWPLETIIIALDETVTGGSINSVIEFLGNFPTLERVELKNLKGLRIKDCEYLELPNLKRLDLSLDKPEIDYQSNIDFFFSLQFLLHCENLERLCWNLENFDDYELRKHLKKKERENLGKILDFRAGLRFLYDSNIWNVFPYLSSVEVKCSKDVKKGSCSHEYLREDVGEIIEVRQFLKTHDCCHWRKGLSSCVVLAE